MYKKRKKKNQKQKKKKKKNIPSTIAHDKVQDKKPDPLLIINAQWLFRLP